MHFTDALVNMVKHLEDTFPSVDVRKNPNSETGWNGINNELDENKYLESIRNGRGRYMTERSLLMETWEQDNDLVVHARTRAYLDVYIAMGLRIILNNATGNPLETVDIPRSGGRFLGTVDGTERQQAHTDNNLRSAEEIKKDNGTAGYFAMATGEEEAEVFIVKHGHRIVNMLWASEEEKIPALNHALKAEKVLIPPFSIIYVRGDCVHFGAGFKDHASYGNVTKEALIRYHIYFIPAGSKLGDVIHRVNNFHPGVWEDESDVGEEEDGDDESIDDNESSDSSDNEE